MKIYTFATHRQGLFDELINNKFVDIRVVGFGSTWKGFMERISQIQKAIVEDAVPDDEILVCLDGFDSRIRLDPKIALERYEQAFPSHPVLYSKDLQDLPSKYLQKKVWMGDLNAGMYMGPAGKVRRVLSACLELNESDDQRAVNIVAKDKKYEVIQDTQELIFKNLAHFKRGPKCTSDETDAVFISCPGDKGIKRLVESFTRYIWKDVLCCFIIFCFALFTLFRFFRKNRLNDCLSREI